MNPEKVTETALPLEKKAEATEILDKIAAFPPHELENALAFLRGMQFAQGIRSMT